MKRLACLITTTLFLASAVFAQVEETKLKRPKFEYPLFFVSNFNVDMPSNSAMPDMPVNVGVGINITAFPFKNLPLGIDARAGFGRYAKHSEEHTFSFENSTTKIDVDTDGKFNRLLFGLKLVDYQSNKLVKPYLVGHVGFGFFRSHIQFPNPNDIDDCLPMISELVHKSNGFIYGAETGLEFNLLNRDYRKISKGEGVFATVSFGFLSSNETFSYINPKKMHDHHTPNPQPSTNGIRVGRTEEISAPFINVSSNEIHYHKVADLHFSQLLLYTFSVGIIFRF